jgi:hypothetical protein
MATPITTDKARRRAERARKRREALLRAMNKDVRVLRKIIRGKTGKK